MLLLAEDAHAAAGVNIETAAAAAVVAQQQQLLLLLLQLLSWGPCCSSKVIRFAPVLQYYNTQRRNTSNLFTV